MSDLSLRICGEADHDALRKLAQRDSAEMPPGRLLAVQAGEGLLAAISLESGEVIADPFVPTADAVELLRRRAWQIGGAARPGPRVKLGQWRRARSRRQSRRVSAPPRSSSSAA
ncbi:MAG TPA: hypothetical protein VKA41_00470 [Solirubrobacterales bacterium]|nr:hypothetical protein [Solirubrobacterales bacterium]